MDSDKWDVLAQLGAKHKPVKPPAKKRSAGDSADPKTADKKSRVDEKENGNGNGNGRLADDHRPPVRLDPEPRSAVSAEAVPHFVSQTQQVSSAEAPLAPPPHLAHRAPWLSSHDPARTPLQGPTLLVHLGFALPDQGYSSATVDGSSLKIDLQTNLFRFVRDRRHGEDEDTYKEGASRQLDMMIARRKAQLDAMIKCKEELDAGNQPPAPGLGSPQLAEMLATASVNQLARTQAKRSRSPMARRAHSAGSGLLVAPPVRAVGSRHSGLDRPRPESFVPTCTLIITQVGVASTVKLPPLPLGIEVENRPPSRAVYTLPTGDSCVVYTMEARRQAPAQASMAGEF